MKAVALRALRLGPSSEPGELRIAGVTIREVRALKRARGGTVLNKAGRLILAGNAGGRRVKIYELASAAHAAFLEHVSVTRPNNISLPEIVGREGRFIACRWVEGAALSSRRMRSVELNRFALLQARTHDADVSALPTAGFDYWTDFIVPRFIRAAELMGKTEFAADAVGRVNRWRAQAPRTLNHPDLTPANLLEVEGVGKMPIDNELLYVGAGAFMDVLNTANSLPEKLRASYLKAYLEAPGSQEMPPADVLRAFWVARRGGAHFVAANINALASLFEDSSDGADLRWIRFAAH